MKQKAENQEEIKALAEWRRKPKKFVRDIFKVKPDDWQDEVLEVFPSKNRIAMKACKGPGKTAVLAWLIWNFLLTRYQSKVAVTSMDADNLADNLWPELAKWRSKSPLLTHLFEWTKTRIFMKEHPEIWFASAQTWAKTADPQSQGQALAGFHADYVLFVLDESGDIPEAVMASAEAGLSTGTEMKIVQAGNPTHLEGPLYRACVEERHLWHVVEITGDPDDPRRSPRISEQWAREQIEKYGRDNPWVLVNVFGQFPPSSLNVLLGPEDVTKAMSRHLREDQYNFAQKRMGVDVARFGNDSNILFTRQGLVAFPVVEMKNARTNDIAARVASESDQNEVEMVLVDSTGGYGAGVEDSLIQAGQSPIPVNFAGKAIDPRYFNKRSEMWYLMAEWVKRGGALPNDPILRRELTAPTYTYHQGKFRLEEKDQIKKRLGFSPDRADALALTFALPDLPSSRLPGSGRTILTSSGHGVANHDYDPLEKID